MAASTNTNQIDLTANADSEVTVSNAQVVLLKNESLTLADGNAVDYTNYGNYKALKVTDDSGNTQYIVSQKGNSDKWQLAVTNSDGEYVRYPLYQHSLEYSDVDQPLQNEDGGHNVGFLAYGQNFGYNFQSIAQRFKDIQQVEIDGTWTDLGKYDLIKGFAVGDTANVTFIKDQGIRNKRTLSISQTGRLAELSGNSDIYFYYVKSVTMPNDERVDGNKTYINEAQWSVRPGINKLLFNTVSSNGKLALQIFADVQGFQTTGFERGFTEDNPEYAGLLLFNFYDDSNQQLASEVVLVNPNTEGYDGAGRFLGTYISNLELDTSEFPIYIEVSFSPSASLGDYQVDPPHYWSEWSEGFSSFGATNPDILSGELLDDPFCIDRHYTDECIVQISNKTNPWTIYRFLCDASATGGGGSASTNTKVMYAPNLINTKIQFQTSITGQFNLFTKGDGIRNGYRYKTKKFQVSTQDRPTMLRTVSMTYMSSNSISLRFITDNGERVKDIFFDRSTNPTEISKRTTTTQVIGLRCKTFEIEVYTVGVAEDNLEINKLSVSYG